MAAHAALERAELRSPTAGYSVDLKSLTRIRGFQAVVSS